MWAVSTKFFQWCSSVPCKYSLGRPVVSQCTLGQPVAFQCTLDQPVYTGRVRVTSRKCTILSHTLSIMDMQTSMCLTPWDRNKMAAIFQTLLFSNGFLWMIMHEFRIKCHWSLFPGVQLTIFPHWFKQWLGDDQATTHYLNYWWLDYRRIHASFGLNDLNITILPNEIFRCVTSCLA